MDHPIQTNKKGFNPNTDKHLIATNREYFNHSEAIAKFMIEKLISLTITEVNKRQIEQKIPDHSFEFMMNIINNYIKLEFMAYEKEDTNLPKNDVKLSIHNSRLEEKDTSNLSNNANNIYGTKRERKSSQKDATIRELILPSSNLLTYHPSPAIGPNQSPTILNNLNSNNNYNPYNSLDSIKDFNNLQNTLNQPGGTYEIVNNSTINNQGAGFFNAIFFDNRVIHHNDWSVIDQPVII
jgi:hypothetical protein